MKKRLVIIPLLLLQFNAFGVLKIIKPLGVSAPQPRHELSVGAALGYSNFIYKIGGLSPELQLRYVFNFGYWALSTGCDFAVYSTNAFLEKNFSESYQDYDYYHNEYFTFSYSFDKYRETQYAEYLCIPLLLRYRQPIDVTRSWYVAGGVRLGFFSGGGYVTNNDSLKTSGYYASDGRTFDDVPEHGLGAYKQKSKGDLEFGTTQQLILEGGIINYFSGNRALTLALYATYGFNNIGVKYDSKELVAYQDAPDAYSPTPSLLNSSLVEKKEVFPFSIGVKIVYSFVKMYRKSSECFPFD